MWVEHERVLAERDRLADEMERMADPIMQIAHLVSQIEACDREIGRLNATAAATFGDVRPVLSGAGPAITALFRDVWFRTCSLGSQGCTRQLFPEGQERGKLRVKRSASSPAVL